MPSPVLIGPQPSTPGLVTTARSRKRAIPQDLLREASQRLAIMCLMAAILWIAATILWHVTWPSLHPGQTWPGIKASEWLGYASGIASFLVWLLIRRQKWEPEVFLKIGLAYMILSCFSVGMVMHWGLPESEMMMVQISWVGVVILMFAALLPTEPKVMLVAGLAAAFMSPLTMIITHVHGLSAIEAFKAGMLMHYPDFLIAFASVGVAAVVTRLGKQVSKAREMGSYQLGELIKRGGMGEIYKATHRMLARPAAIKLIRPEMLGGADGETAELAIKRFKREAEAAANLRSPHTVELFDFGVTEDNTLYFVMELLDGVDLETLVREGGPLPPRRVIHILRQVCESLAEAHESGLVHRDIKPANIHLGKAGVRRDHVKVLDFGLVKSVKQEPMGDSLATAVGRTPGTPAYMAPEMMLSETIDSRADIYALGCVGYYLLTGKLVFDASNAFQMIANHLRSEPVPPSVRGNVDIPRPLETMILKCLAKKQDDRYASVLEMSKDLAAINLKPWSEEEALAAWAARQPVVGGSVAAASERGVLAPI
ncbi:MAG TPA: serine/threonine-protein kinase [Gemmatimonadaceae bacterium]|jgi:serine/threonine-protein kinase|nr:serine/threonine-protein kinase [Gemmatimonadaceae bacterium]